MASVESRINKGKKTYRIRLSEGEHPDRPRIGLGAVTKKDANTAATNIANLVNHCNSGGAISPATLDWLGKVRPFVRRRLETLGLIEAATDTTQDHTVETWCKAYIAMREKDGQTKADSIRKMKDVSKRLSLFFKNTPLGSVTKLEAKSFKSFLVAKVKLAENTARKHIAISRQFFNAAIESRIIVENPFRGQPVTV
nr:phage integrase SAM-like domain-containing protein [Planctomycetota bacterium]